MFFYYKTIVQEKGFISCIEYENIYLFKRNSVHIFSREFQFIKTVSLPYSVKDTLLFREGVYILTEDAILEFTDLNFTNKVYKSYKFKGSKLEIFFDQPIALNPRSIYFIKNNKVIKLEKYVDIKFNNALIYVLNEEGCYIYEYRDALIHLRKIEVKDALFLFLKDNDVFFINSKGIVFNDKCIYYFTDETPLKQQNDFLLTSKRIYKINGKIEIFYELSCNKLFIMHDFILCTGKENYLIANRKDIKSLDIISNDFKIINELNNGKFELLNHKGLTHEFINELSTENSFAYKLSNEFFIIITEFKVFIYNLENKNLISNPINEEIKDVLLLKESIYLINANDNLLNTELYFSLDNSLFYIQNKQLVELNLNNEKKEYPIAEGRYLVYKDILFIYKNKLIRMYKLNEKKIVCIQLVPYTIKDAYIIGYFMYLFTHGNILIIFKILHTQLSLPYFYHLKEEILNYKNGIFYLKNYALLFKGYKEIKIKNNDKMIYDGNNLIFLNEKLEIYQPIIQEIIPEEEEVINYKFMIINNRIIMKENDFTYERIFDQNISHAARKDKYILIGLENELILLLIGKNNLIKKDKITFQSNITSIKYKKYFYILTEYNSIKKIEIIDNKLKIKVNDIQRRRIEDYKIYNDFILVKERNRIILLKEDIFYNEICNISIDTLLNYYFNKSFYFLKEDGSVDTMKTISEKVFYYFHLLSDDNILYSNKIPPVIDFNHKLLNDFSQEEIHSILEIMYQK